MIIRTERLTLRPFAASDALAIAALAGDPRVARMLVDIPLPFDETAARRWLRFSWGELRLGVERSGELIGGVCYFCYMGSVGGLGYWLGHEHWGHGYGTEAAQALVRQGFEAGRLRRFRSAHFVDNPASGRILTRLGFRPCGRSIAWSPARQDQVESIHYSLDRQAAGHAPARVAISGLLGFRPIDWPLIGGGLASAVVTSSAPDRHRRAGSGP